MDGAALNREGADPCRPLRLLAQDDEDLQIVSAALQDAIAHLGDIRYAPRERTLTIMFNRYRWEGAHGPCGERVVSALQLGDVLRVRQRGLGGEDRGALVSCLAMDFEPGEAPGGRVTLRFSHGGDLAAEVECIDAVLADVSEAWPAARCPDHEAVAGEGAR
jgi:hypothetical protein